MAFSLASAYVTVAMVAPGVGRAVWAEPGTAASANARRRARPTATPLPIPGHWTSEDYGVQLPEDAAEEDQLELHVQAGRPTGGRAPGSSGAIPPPEKPRRPAKGESKRDRKHKAGKKHLKERSFTKASCGVPSSVMWKSMQIHMTKEQFKNQWPAAFEVHTSATGVSIRGYP